MSREVFLTKRLAERGEEVERLRAMEGLEGRLARLLVTDDTGQRFVLSDRSAANIAAIAREWVKHTDQQQAAAREK